MSAVLGDFGGRASSPPLPVVARGNGEALGCLAYLSCTRVYRACEVGRLGRGAEAWKQGERRVRERVQQGRAGASESAGRGGVARQPRRGGEARAVAAEVVTVAAMGEIVPAAGGGRDSGEGAQRGQTDRGGTSSDGRGLLEGGGNWRGHGRLPGR